MVLELCHSLALRVRQKRQLGIANGQGVSGPLLHLYEERLISKICASKTQELFLHRLMGSRRRRRRRRTCSRVQTPRLDTKREARALA